MHTKKKVFVRRDQAGGLVASPSFSGRRSPILPRKGIRKFIAFDLPLEQVRWRHGGHYTVVEDDLAQTDDLRVLDFDGHHIFDLFRFSKLGPPIFHEEG